MAHLMQLFSHLTEPKVLAEFGEYLLLIVFLLSLFEVIFPPIPGDTFLVISGSITVAAQTNPLLVVVAAFSGTFLGSFLLYNLGLKMGKKLLHSPRFSWLMDSKTFIKIEHGFSRHGFLIIILSRFLPVARSGVALAAGMVGMDMRRSLMALAVSILMSTSIFVYGGRFLGRRIDSIVQFWENQSESILLALLFTVILFLAVAQWIKYCRQKQDKK